MRPHPLLQRYYATEEERRQRVRSWFDQSAPHYNAITQAMSFGSGHWYRRRALARTGIGPGGAVLDVACGTGVLADAARALVGPRGRVVALDPSAGMLVEARRRGTTRLLRAAAEALPLADASFDLLTMGFALRHVADLEATFAEYRRVLRRGGGVLLLEITPPDEGLPFRLLRFYLRRVVPLLARRHGRTPAVLMSYYWDTIEQCVAPPAILAALAASGFARAERRVELGVFSEYSAVAA